MEKSGGKGVGLRMGEREEERAKSNCKVLHVIVTPSTRWRSLSLYSLVLRGKLTA